MRAEISHNNFRGVHVNCDGGDIVNLYSETDRLPRTRVLMIQAVAWPQRDMRAGMQTNSAWRATGNEWRSLGVKIPNSAALSAPAASRRSDSPIHCQFQSPSTPPPGPLLVSIQSRRSSGPFGKSPGRLEFKQSRSKVLAQMR